MLIAVFRTPCGVFPRFSVRTDGAELPDPSTRVAPRTIVPVRRATPRRRHACLWGTRTGDVWRL